MYAFYHYLSQKRLGDFCYFRSGNVFGVNLKSKQTKGSDALLTPYGETVKFFLIFSTIVSSRWNSAYFDVKLILESLLWREICPNFNFPR